MFSFDPSFDDGPLIPHNDQWPLFDEVVMSSSTSTSPSIESDPLPPAFPSSAALAAMPIPPTRTSPRNKNPNHIPRPRNAFMLFRSAFAAAQKVSANIEHDNRHITRIIAYCWNRLSDAEKQTWRDLAAAEKAQHAERYPDYRFKPVGRAKMPKKRKVRRNGVEDVKRCETVAELVMAGKQGHELERAFFKIVTARDSAEPAAATELDVFVGDEKRTTLFDDGDVPPFRSPLLPPAKTSQQVPEDNMLPEPLVISTPPRVEPQTFYSPTGTDASTLDDHDDLVSLFHSPCYQYYQLNDAPSPPAHYQTLVGFVQNNQRGNADPEQSVPDFSLFPWNQSDSFSYYN
ncbi:hypothetical protein OG21DRAFT_1505312 [Imleria badia]|nr:hypothetical protein OG21DRAFT_1505312 [Imleria badia]